MENQPQPLNTPIDHKPAPLDIRDNSTRSTIVIILFCVLILLYLFATVSGYWELQLLEIIDSNGYYTDEQLESNDSRQMIVGISQSALNILLAIFFIHWFRRAYGNAHRLNINKLSHTEDWAIWGFIIPIISLWYPYKIATEINETNHKFLKENNPDYDLSENKWSINAWWIVYIITNYIASFALRSAFTSDTVQDMIGSTKAYILSDFGDIFAALLTVLMILKVSEKEKLVQKTLKDQDVQPLIY